jgi:Flp pilus assembly protein TadG
MRVLTRRSPLARDQSGSVTIIVTVAMMALVMAAGMGVDLSRVWLVRSSLQTALDSASLVAAREIGVQTANADTAAMFWSNFARNGQSGGAGYFGAMAAPPTIVSPSANAVTVSAAATLNLTFGAIFGVRNVTVSESAQAMRATTGMELALVLDNTGSMAGWPITAVQESATELVNDVYGAGSQDTVPNLWVSVVPFSAEVNLGPSHTAWLAPGTYTPSAYDNASWMGCVMARHTGGHDADDTNPTQAPFTPFFYASTLNKYKDSHGHVLPGDDDWSASNITETRQATLPQNTAVGPDLGCVPLPVLPETASRSTVLSLINQMVPTFRGGTFINLGLQAGWFTISPNWRGWWGSSTLPLAYNTPNMQKVIVLMTDGSNEWYSWPNGAPDNQGNGDATSYGRESTNVLGLSPSNATTYLNGLMSTMCTTIKSHGIIIYTILFDHSAVPAQTEALFQNCASSPQNYFLTPTASDLEAAFSTIGSQLASLRLTQ